MSRSFRRNSPVFVNIDMSGEEQTNADDLSAADRFHVRGLATSFIRENLALLGISFKERKNESPKKNSSLWGMSLESLLKRDHNLHPYAKIPIIFDEIFNLLEARGIEVEGILRIPGAAARIRALRDHLEKQQDCQTANYEWGDVRVNDVAALMKQFLRELPQPLLTNEWVEAFVVVGKIEDQEKKRQLLNHLILALSDVHRDCLKRLLLFLDRVVENEERNKMSLSSVATIMAPNLFLPAAPPRVHGKNRDNKIKKKEVDLAKDTAGVVEALIQYHAQLWRVPEPLMDTLRLRYASRTDTTIPIKRMILCGCFSSSRTQSDEDESLLRNPMLSRQVRLSLFSPADRRGSIARGSICGGSSVGQSAGARDSLALPDEEAVINVFSRKSSLARTITSLHIDTTTTAGQVVAQFCRLHGVERLVSTSPEETRPRILPGLSSLHIDPEEPYKLFLYEMGGNVGERRLDHEANLREALNKNPNATWVVKNRLQTTK